MISTVPLATGTPRNERDGHRHLAAAVLWQAVRDACSTGHIRATDRASAADLLTDKHGTLAPRCQLAGLCPRAVRQRARQILDESLPRSSGPR